MAPKRNQVTVYSDKIAFPSCCPKCLGKNNLVYYTSKWETAYLRENKKIKRQASISIPICQSCKETLIKKTRKQGAYLFGILFPFTWMILIFALIIPSFMKFLESILTPGLITLLLLIFWGLFFLVALAGFGMLTSPKIFIDWPVKLEKHYVQDIQTKKRSWRTGSEWTERHLGSTFSFENQPYSKLFADANPYSSPSLDPVEQIIEKLNNEKTYDRQKAARALGKTKDPRAIEPLIAALSLDESKVVRQAAADALGQIGDVRAVEALTEAKEDKSSFIRLSAKAALQDIKETTEKTDIKTLKRNLSSEDWYVAKKAVSALGKRKDPEVVEPLIKALKDQKWQVRQEAAVALGKRKELEAVEPLIKALKDQKWQVRNVAADALGQIGDVRAVEALTEAKEDKSRWVRRYAKKALEKIKETTE